MSEFTNTSDLRSVELADYMLGLLKGGNGLELIEKHAIKTSKFIPHDIINAFDILMEKNIPVDDLKYVSNKLINILFHTILEYPALTPPENSILSLLTTDNAIALQKLKDSRELIKAINKKVDSSLLVELAERFVDIEKFMLHYTVIENVVFPFMESGMKHHQCVKIMWSFHDDIRRNLSRMISLLKAGTFDLKEFNTLSGLLFFNINTIILREEKIIFPILLETLSVEIMQDMLLQTQEIGLPFATITLPVATVTNNGKPSATTVFAEGDLVHLPTGVLTVEQFNMIFNFLPVDITYVDENDTVKFYSNPPHRIFPRTPAIIGRKVQNCHPPESVDVVNRIIASFKSGEKSVASFWFHMGPRFILIQYYALRDPNLDYRGVLEVSQEISGIQQIEGERKLLDW
ncbi:MAG: PAS domain-containing protein [Paludibacter sp.]|nr:PAS domain-containing protein [Paludibacter sp.]